MRVPDLTWPEGLFDDVAVPAESRFIPTIDADEPFWPAMRTRWIARRPQAEAARVLPFRPVLRSNGFGEAA